MASDHVTIRAEIDAAAEALEVMRRGGAAADKVEAVADACGASLGAGGKILAFGNGGSAADAMHFCEELTGRYRDDRPPIGAMACIDAGHLTCTANDFGYEAVFERWVRGLARVGDVVVGLSTSGNSENVRLAFEAAGTIGCVRLALLGKDGGAIAGMCEHEIIVPGQTADRIQELHMLLLHTLVGAIERRVASVG